MQIRPPHPFGQPVQPMPPSMGQPPPAPYVNRTLAGSALVSSVVIAVGAFLPWSETYTQSEGFGKVTGFDTAGAPPFLVAWLGATLAVTALVAGKATNEAAIGPGMLGVVLCGYSWLLLLVDSDEIVRRRVSDGLIISLAGSVVLTAIGVMAIIEGRRRIRQMHMTRPR